MFNVGDACHARAIWFCLFRGDVGDAGPVRCYDAINAAAAALPGWIGAPVEAMALDFQSGQQTIEPWRAAEAMLRSRPGRTELLVAYYTCLHGEAGRACVSFEGASAACVVTVSLPDMTIAHDSHQVIEVCLSLLAMGDFLGSTCVVAAGGEIELDAELGSPRRAIAAAMDRHSLAGWVGMRRKPGGLPHRLSSCPARWERARAEAGVTII